MFVGHFAVALAVKSRSRETPLWTLIGASQLLDIGWGGLVLAGVEKFRIDTSLPGSPLDLYHMPYTHGLPAAILWSLLAGWGAKARLKQSSRSAMLIGAVVFSHWILDLLVHRPDLPLGFMDIKVGFALWSLPGLELGLELLMFAAGGILWLRASHPPLRRAAGFLAWLLVLQLADETSGNPTLLFVVVGALVSYLSAVAWAWYVEAGANTPIRLHREGGTDGCEASPPNCAGPV